MGGKQPKETQEERQGRLLRRRETNSAARALRQRDALIARGRRRSPLYGGPEGSVLGAGL